MERENTLLYFSVDSLSFLEEYTIMFKNGQKIKSNKDEDLMRYASLINFPIIKIYKEVGEEKIFFETKEYDQNISNRVEYEVIKVNRINEIKKIEGSDAEREMKIAKKNYELSQQKQSEHYSCEFLLNGKWCLIETDNCSPCKNIKKLLLGGITEYLKDKYKIDLGFRKTTVGDKRIIDGSVIVDEINNFRFKIDSNQGLISLYPNPSNEKQQYIFEPKNVLSVISDVYGCKKIQSTPSSQSSKDIDDNSNQPNAEDLMDIDDNSNQPNAEQLMDIDDNSSQSHTEKLIHQQPISFDGTSCTRPNASLNEANSPSPLYTMHNDGKQGVYPNATINEGECDFFKSFEKGKINEQEGTNGFINGTGNKVIWISDKNFQNHEIPSQPLSVATSL